MAGLCLVAAVVSRANEQTPGEVIFDLVVAEDMPGKYVKGGCMPFARELYGRLNRNGTEVHLITYAWNNGFGGFGVHAFVVYRDDEGRYWGMDNERRQPLWVTGKTPRAWCQAFSPATSIAIRSHASSLTPSPTRRSYYPIRVATMSPPAVPVAEKREPVSGSGQEMIAAMSAQSQSQPLYFGTAP